ncbi:MAG: TerB family tellurite resistance protein [Flavobacteriia bacterium]
MEHVARAFGYLVYAVASSDKHVSDEEKLAVHSALNEEWKMLADKEDPFGVRAMDFIDKMMIQMVDLHISSEDAFLEFHSVFEAHKEHFTPEIRRFMIESCIRTGSAFNRMNKSELVLLSRIEQLLK